MLPETDDDAARIMTIHAAKGLEFPIASVSGLSTAPSARAAAAEVAFPPGSAVVVFTDGVIEARRERELYGEERLDAVLAECRGLSADELVERVVEDCRAFGGELTEACGGGAAGFGAAACGLLRPARNSASGGTAAISARHIAAKLRAAAESLRLCSMACSSSECAGSAKSSAWKMIASPPRP